MLLFICSCRVSAYDAGSDRTVRVDTISSNVEQALRSTLTGREEEAQCETQAF
jgi:hypothetical protein